MTLHIQDPGNENTAYLIDEIIAACRGASNGGGIFAFASVSGIRLLLENEEFNEFLESGAFHLVVGLDAVTNEKAVQLLREMDAAKGGLTVSAFLNPRTGALFHPKMSWFMHPTGGSVIVGSGNLTSGGLRDNWESFAVLSLSLSEIELAIAEWDEWFLTNGTAVLSIHEPEVLKRALLNRPIQIAGTSVQLSDDPDDGLLPALTPSPDVLVAEIPKGARWKQAGFSRSVFTGFFGATPGTISYVSFQHILQDGTFEAEEYRQSVSVRSQNFRFELAAASGLAYPSGGPPVGVFVKVAARQFFYQLIMPDDVRYSDLNRFLLDNWSGGSRNMKRVIGKAETLFAACPNPVLQEAINKPTASKV